MPSKSGRKILRNPVFKSERSHASNVYGELLAEAGPSSSAAPSGDRPLKRPRLGASSRRDLADTTPASRDVPARGSDAAQHAGIPMQAVVTDTDNDSLAYNEESELEFEDVTIEERSITSDTNVEDSDQDVNIVVTAGSSAATSTPRRKTGSQIPKPARVLAHKAHLVTLLGYGMIANSRCNSYAIQKRLRRLLPQPVRDLLTPDEHATQFQRNHALMNGLQRAVDIFKGRYRVTANGMRRAAWKTAEDIQTSTTMALDNVTHPGFKSASRSLSGSQDVGAQLFCAMLRSVGVKTRLAFSVQVLPLSASQARQATPQRTSAIALTITPGHNQTATRVQNTASSRAKSVQKLVYPVFWTEVFDSAYQKWIPVDAMVTHTVRKPSKLEPPASYDLNQMAYVVAFGHDGSAKDVTRRYASSFNAKTRRLRVDSLGPAEALWLRKLLRLFRPLTYKSDEAAIEDAELSRREASESMPTNVLDFIGHPVYALERHLKRSEVIHPRREAGRVNTGTAAKPKVEPVFRRQDVHVCRSADQWYRFGRIIRSGAQPLKTAPNRRKPDKSDTESADEQESESVALYSVAQTELYIPKRVSRGRVPRNAFGNVDVYVPSMVPRDGAHTRHPLVKEAAAILEIDAADAVVGFRWTGRKGATVIEGAIVPKKHEDAVKAVIEGLEWDSIITQCQARSLIALRLWRKCLQALRIKERVAAYGTAADASSQDSSDQAEHLMEMSVDAELFTAGQYDESELVTLLNQPKGKPPPKYSSRIIDDTSSSSEDELSAVDEDEKLPGGFETDAEVPRPTGVVERNGHPDMRTPPPYQSPAGYEADSGGGFLVDQEHEAEVNAHARHVTAIQSAEIVPAYTELDGSLTSMTENIDDRQSANIPSIGGLQLPDTMDHDADLGPGDSTDAEKGSRFSHDPEDEDADPDWMVSD